MMPVSADNYPGGETGLLRLVTQLNASASPLGVLRSMSSAALRARKAQSAPRLVILGPPAGGKGTQCELLVDLLGVVHLSTGDILRQAIRNQTPLGIQAQHYTDSGELVPDELIVHVVLNRLTQPDCTARGWLLDGFPRTATQVHALLSAHGGMATPDCVLELQVPDQEVIRRIAGRRVDPDTGRTYHMEFNPPPPAVLHRVVQRSDDTEEKLRTRLRQFHANSDAVRAVFEAHRNEHGTAIQVMRADGYQPAPSIAETFAALAFQRAAERESNVPRRHASLRNRRRLLTGAFGVRLVPDSRMFPVRPVNARTAGLLPQQQRVLLPSQKQLHLRAEPETARFILRNLRRFFR